MISAKACFEASELLAEREELAQQRATMQGALRIRVNYEADANNGFLSGPTLPMTEQTWALLTGSLESEIEAIDEKLRALGVEPPADGEDWMGDI